MAQRKKGMIVERRLGKSELNLETRSIFCERRRGDSRKRMLTGRQLKTLVVLQKKCKSVGDNGKRVIHTDDMAELSSSGRYHSSTLDSTTPLMDSRVFPPSAARKTPLQTKKPHSNDISLRYDFLRRFNKTIFQ